MTYRGARYEGVIPLEELLARTGFGRDEVPNRGRRPDIEALRRLLPNAVAKAREWVAARRRDFEERVNEKLNRELSSAPGQSAAGATSTLSSMSTWSG